MKKTKILLLILTVLLISSTFLSCSNKQKIHFKETDAKVTFKTDTSLTITNDYSDESKYIITIRNEDVTIYGAITISKEDSKKSVSELTSKYLPMHADNMTEELISDELLFIDISAESSEGQLINGYNFMYYDADKDTIVCGRFSASTDHRDTLLSIAKSIKIK